MNDERLERFLIRPDATIRDAMIAIDRGAYEIALLVDERQRLLGAVSDGDIRRALLAGASLDDPAAGFATTQPTVVGPSTERADVLDIMRARAFSQVPIVDDTGQLIGMHVLRELLGGAPRRNMAVIIAGGRGTRLGPLTEQVPKPMIKVAGRPILERIVLHLVSGGIRHILISVAYLGHLIEDHFGDGSAFGCRIDYLREQTDRPLGTGGPLSLVSAVAGPPDTPLLVMYADLVTQFSVGAMLDAHADHGAALTVAVRDYHHQVPFGVVDLDQSGSLLTIAEKPVESWKVNAGIYVVSPSLLERVPTDCEYPLTDLIDQCLRSGDRVAAWEIDDDWLDVGRPVELKRARGEL